jgi:cystathionine beta-lyase
MPWLSLKSAKRPLKNKKSLCRPGLSGADPRQNQEDVPMSLNPGLNTICVHAGTKRDPLTGGVNTPCHGSSSYLHPNPHTRETAYPRYSNTPSQKAPAEKIAALEGAEAGLVLASGMAAVTTAILAFAQKGDHLIFQSGLYGGTQYFLRDQLERMGISYDFALPEDPGSFARAIRPNTRLIYVETPNNPLLKITDLALIAELAQANGLVSIADNTFASPVNQNPLKQGIDLVVHSGTKYLNGHSDLVCGAIAASQKHIQKVHQVMVNLGGSLNMQDCQLLERGLKTLGLRVARQNQNAAQMADFLARDKRVKKVYYPGLADHPGHEVAKKQMKGMGGMLSFELAAGPKEAAGLMSMLKVITPAISLGGVESLICRPGQTSHAHLSAEQKQAEGVTDSLLRLSLGIEEIEDLLDDMDQALSRALS